MERGVRAAGARAEGTRDGPGQVAGGAARPKIAPGRRLCPPTPAPAPRAVDELRSN